MLVNRFLPLTRIFLPSVEVVTSVGISQFIDINRCGGYSRLFVVCIRCGNAVRLDTGFRFFVNIRCRKGTSDQYIVSINVILFRFFAGRDGVLSISIEPLRFGRPMSDQLALLSELSRIGRPVVFCRYDWDLNIYPYEMYCLCLILIPVIIKFTISIGSVRFFVRR